MTTASLAPFFSPLVLVVGASPDRINHNAVMRGFVCEGINEVLGPGNAAECGLDVAVPRVLAARPLLVLVFGSCMPDVCDYGPLRDACDRTGAMLAFWLHDDPYEFDFGFRATDVADWVFSNDRWAAMHHNHPRVRFLPLGASPRAHVRAWRSEKTADVFFCGVGFPNRITLLKDLATSLTGQRTRIQGAEWPSHLTLARNERLSNAEWSDACAGSWVTLNMGRTLHLANRRYQLDAATPGPRTFEAALAGTVQMAFVDGLSISDFFEPGREVLLFDDPQDFATQLEELLADPSRCHAIAESARARALRDHTYAARCRQLLACINHDSLRLTKVTEAA
jgi:spore maturation protein CgeB